MCESVQAPMIVPMPFMCGDSYLITAPVGTPTASVTIANPDAITEKTLVA